MKLIRVIEYEASDQSYEDEILQYGRKGMKWGQSIYGSKPHSKKGSKKAVSKIKGRLSGIKKKASDAHAAHKTKKAKVKAEKKAAKQQEKQVKKGIKIIDANTMDKATKAKYNKMYKRRAEMSDDEIRNLTSRINTEMELRKAIDSMNKKNKNHDKLIEASTTLIKELGKEFIKQSPNLARVRLENKRAETQEANRHAEEMLKNANNAKLNLAKEANRSKEAIAKEQTARSAEHQKTLRKEAKAKMKQNEQQHTEALFNAYKNAVNSQYSSSNPYSGFTAASVASASRAKNRTTGYRYTNRSTARAFNSQASWNASSSARSKSRKNRR